MSSTDHDHDDQLYKRIAALEAAVQELQRALDSRSTTASPQTGTPDPAPKIEVATASEATHIEPELYVAPAPPRPRVVAQVEPVEYALRVSQVPEPEFRLPSAASVIRTAETWLSKVGIVIFLFGVAFLFKYSIDKGWLNEQVRIGMGIIFGTLLLGLGLWLRGKRRNFSQVLMGGGIATYYITGYAAFNLFPDLNIPYEVVFGFMTLVTVLAFALSVWQDTPLLSIIGIAGGLLTPFVLNRVGIQLPGLVGYTCLVIAGAIGIYMRRGWRSLLFISLLGGWCILLLGRVLYIFVSTPDDRWALQSGAAFMLLAFWAMPVLREVLFARSPARWPRPTIASWDPDLRKIVERQVNLLTIATPLAVLAYSANLWSILVSKETWGVIAITGAVLFTTSFLALRRYTPSLQSLAYAHILEAIALLTTGLVSLLSGNTLLFALAVEGAALHLVARRFSDPSMATCANLIFIAVGIWLAERLLPGMPRLTPNIMPGTVEEQAIWNPQALTDLAVIGIAGAVSFVVRERNAALIMRSLALVALLAWLWRELHSFDYGDRYVMLAWAACAILLHLASRWLEGEGLDLAGDALSAVTGAWLLASIVFGLIRGNEDRPAIFTPEGLTSLGVIALGAAGYILVRRRQSQYQQEREFAYALWLHFALLGWTWQELGLMPNGNGYVSVVWGVYAVALVTAGLRLGRNIPLLTCGIITLFAVAAKLFLIDLRYLEAIWRILLFLGFGGFFLLVSYFFQGAVRSDVHNSHPAPRTPGTEAPSPPAPRARS